MIVLPASTPAQSGHDSSIDNQRIAALIQKILFIITRVVRTFAGASWLFCLGVAPKLLKAVVAHALGYADLHGRNFKIALSSPGKRELTSSQRTQLRFSTPCFVVRINPASRNTRK